jgi:hypothetical protein
MPESASAMNLVGFFYQSLGFISTLGLELIRCLQWGVTRGWNTDRAEQHSLLSIYIILNHPEPEPGCR